MPTVGSTHRVGGWEFRSRDQVISVTMRIELFESDGCGPRDQVVSVTSKGILLSYTKESKVYRVTPLIRKRMPP